MNETKRDVFNDALAYVPVGREYDPVNDNEAGDLSSCLSARYAAALPDDLPVIPESVSDLLVAQKQYYRPLSNVLGPVHELGVMRQQSSNPSLNWVANHENEFARAWVLEVWKVKETKEVVKL